MMSACAVKPGEEHQTPVFPTPDCTEILLFHHIYIYSKANQQNFKSLNYLYFLNLFLTPIKPVTTVSAHKQPHYFNR